MTFDSICKVFVYILAQDLKIFLERSLKRIEKSGFCMLWLDYVLFIIIKRYKIGVKHTFEYLTNDEVFSLLIQYLKVVATSLNDLLRF